MILREIDYLGYHIILKVIKDNVYLIIDNNVIDKHKVEVIKHLEQENLLEKYIIVQAQGYIDEQDFPSILKEIGWN